MPEWTADAMFDAVLGYRVARPSYAKHAAIEDRTATRDLRRLVQSGPFDAVGNTRGRFYVASGTLRSLRDDVRAGREALVDPYPWRSAELRRRAGR